MKSAPFEAEGLDAFPNVEDFSGITVQILSSQLHTSMIVGRLQRLLREIRGFFVVMSLFLGIFHLLYSHSL